MPDPSETVTLSPAAEQFLRLTTAADTAGKLATLISAARDIDAPCSALENLQHRTIADANDAAAQLIGVDAPTPE